MADVHVPSIHYDQIRSPKLILRAANRAHSYPTGSSSSYREPIHIRRYRTDHELHSHESAHDQDRHYRLPLSGVQGRLVVRTTRCESEVNCDYGAPSTLSSSSYGGRAIDILEVSPSRPGFVRSPGVSPGHSTHPTEQHGYFSVPPPRQHSPYNTVRSNGVRYVANPDAHMHDRTWSDVQIINKDLDDEVDEEMEELRRRNAGYWAGDEPPRYSEPDYGYNTQQNYSYHNTPVAPAPRKVTTPTGTIRVNGAIVNAAPPKKTRHSVLPTEPIPQSAFFGFNPTPRSQRAPSSTGTGTVLRRGLHRHQQRRHSEGDTDDHVHGPTQDECRQCNGEGCVRSLAMKEYLRKMEQEGGRGGNPEAWGPGLRQLMGYNE